MAGNDTTNTSLEGPPPGPADAETDVNYSGLENLVQGGKATEITTEPGEAEFVYDDDGTPASPEDVAAAEADGTIEEEQSDTVEVRIKGRTLSLPREDAAALEEYRRENRERDGRLGGELQTTRERLAALEAVQTDRSAGITADQGPERPDPKLALSDFPEYARLQDKYTDHKVNAAVGKLATAYNEDKVATKQALIQEQSDRSWVGGFYQDHAHLNTPSLRSVVSQVFAENLAELEEYGTNRASAYGRLAELTETRVAELTNTSRTLRRPPVMEGATRAVRKVISKEPPRSTFSASNWIARERLKMSGQDTN